MHLDLERIPRLASVTVEKNFDDVEEAVALRLYLHETIEDLKRQIEDSFRNIHEDGPTNLKLRSENAHQTHEADFAHLKNEIDVLKESSVEAVARFENEKSKIQNDHERNVQPF